MIYNVTKVDTHSTRVFGCKIIYYLCLCSLFVSWMSSYLGLGLWPVYPF